MKVRERLRIFMHAAIFTVCLGATAWGDVVPDSRNTFLNRHLTLPVDQKEPRQPMDALSSVMFWNEVALNANALDHTPVAPGEKRVFGEQLGPGRTARAFAIVHIAIFDAVNAITGGYVGYTDIAAPRVPVSMEAAIAQAAHDTLTALYPSQSRSFDRYLADDLRRIKNSRAKEKGIDLGSRAAAAILVLRQNDGSDHPEPVVGIDFITSHLPGKWRVDPLMTSNLAMGTYWGEVKPFVIPPGIFKVKPPPPLTSREYTADFNLLKRLGGDGITTATDRTEDQTNAGIFWAYDGTPGLGTPPRLYNQIVVQLAMEKGLGAVELARLLALINVGMADAGMDCWKWKYEYQFWRPITAIREADPGTGPTGLGDGNPYTMGDPDFTPLGAPASNVIGPNFSPPFPAYTSGHATLGGTVFQILRKYFGTDKIQFTFVSDELNGMTRDNLGNVRPLRPRTFKTLSQAEEENGQSRIYLGIHWTFDKVKGIAHGRQVADYLMKKAFLPIRKN